MNLSRRTSLSPCFRYQSLFNIFNQLHKFLINFIIFCFHYLTKKSPVCDDLNIYQNADYICIISQILKDKKKIFSHCNTYL